MNLFNVLRPECVSVDVKADNKMEAIEQIARIAKNSELMENIPEDEIARVLHEREVMTSTGLGDGFAIPHCQLPGMKDFVVGLMVVPDGVDFDAHDGEKVFEFIFIIGPSSNRRSHLRLLSAVSQVMMLPKARREIRVAKTPEILYETFLMFVKDELDPAGHDGKDLIHVFIENEKHFRNILQIFESMETASVMVVESKDPVEYLAKMPLFAGFWHDKHIPFSRIIVGIIDKKMVNDTLRRIQQVTGKLGECRNVMVTIQELMYANGVLAVE